MRTGRGLAPIDATVAVAVVLLLVATLVPAMRRAKEQENLAKCLANLGQWNPVISTYVEDNDGKFLSGYGRENSWWVARLEYCDQSRIENDLWFCPKAEEPLYDEHHKRSDTFSVFQSWGVYTDDFNGHEDLSPDGVAGSYGLNGYLLAHETPADSALESGGQQSNFWGTWPARGAEGVPLFVEALDFDIRPQEHEGPAGVKLAAWTGNQMARACINRHVGFEAASFCDFSARKVGLKELWTLKWHRSFNTMGPWTRAGGVETTNWPQWIRQFKDY